MGFKQRGRRGRKSSGSGGGTGAGGEVELEVECDVSDCKEWADKKVGGRSIALDNALEVWGDGGLKREARRVRICKKCYREWKKARKDEPDPW
jgi:hypothetical protein